MKIPNTLDRYGTITPSGVFTSPRARSSMKSGSMPTWAGTTIAVSSSANSRSRPGKRSLAKA